MEPITWTVEQFLEWFFSQEPVPRKRDCILKIETFLRERGVDVKEGRWQVAAALDVKVPDFRFTIEQRRVFTSLIEGLR